MKNTCRYIYTHPQEILKKQQERKTRAALRVKSNYSPGVLIFFY